jgi:DnaJ domain
MTVGKHTRPPRTLYELLGVRPNADDDALRTAYRKGVRANHPDLNPGKADARSRFEQIVRAYEILTNPEQRADYDELLAVERAERRARLRRVIATDAATIVALSIVLVGGYVMFAHVAQTSLETTKLVQIAEHKIARVAAVEPTAKVEPTPTAESTTPNPQSAPVPEIGASVAAPGAAAPGTVAPSAVPPSEYGRNPPVVASDTEAQTSVAEVAEPKDADRKGEPSAKSEAAGPGNAAVAQGEPMPEAAEKTPTIVNDDPSGGHAAEVGAPADTGHQAEAGHTPSREAPPGDVPSSEPAASTAAAPSSEQPVTAGKDEPAKDDPAKVNEAAAPTADTGRPAEPSGASSPTEPASTANLQSPAAPEPQSTDPSVTGNGGPAASPTGSENGATTTVDTATAPISNTPISNASMDRGDVRENDRKNDSGPDPLDQTPTRPADMQAPVIGKGIELPKPRPPMTTRPGEGPDVKMAGRPRVRAVRSTADRASTKQAALESRSAPQIAFENRTNRVTPVFGVGF